ncbi:SIR2 family protein [Archangium violaceum]|uniref:effector-associated domain EAD1-containing protein n=1 Tax=Archangium violaceum TaxID=83451 RepID=UPI002B2A206A|nr:SIR2 family protein [Archangium violaceum]
MPPLTGSHFKAFSDALRSAFPSRATLARMLRFELNVRLDDISSDRDDLRTAIDRVFEHFESTGQLEALLKGALAENPGNPSLKAFAASLGALPPSSGPAHSTGGPSHATPSAPSVASGSTSSATLGGPTPWSAADAPLVDDLAKELAAKRVVLIVGAGVSISSTGGAPTASWLGLLEHGVRWCRSYANPPVDDAWKDRQLEALKSGDTDEAITTAESIQRKLQSGDFRRWLQEGVGNLSLTRPELLKELRGLGQPLVTTNYDRLLEDGTTLKPVTWRQTDEMLRFLRGEPGRVLHLHGYYDDPESVVLGVRSYDRILADKATQAAMRSLSLTHTLLLVGFGAGLGDPNFDALLKWMGEALSSSSFSHYRLVLNPDLAAARKNHPPEQRVRVLGYGDNFSDLPGYIRALSAKAARHRGP